MNESLKEKKRFREISILDWISLMYYQLSHPSPEDMPVTITLRTALMKVVPKYLKRTIVAGFCRSETKVANTDIEMGSMISVRNMISQGGRD